MLPLTLARQLAGDSHAIGPHPLRLETNQLTILQTPPLKSSGQRLDAAAPITRATRRECRQSPREESADQSCVMPPPANGADRAKWRAELPEQLDDSALGAPRRHSRDVGRG